MGLGLCRFSSTKRLSPGPLATVWSWSGHSPPLSHTGQSSGWLISRNSSTPSWALVVTSEVVETSIPGVTSSMHVGCSAGPRPVSTSQMHIRHMPTGSIRGW